MVAKVDNEKCTGCGSCVEACPAETIKMINNKAIIDQNNCTGCGVCVDTCPNQAIELS